MKAYITTINFYVNESKEIQVHKDLLVVGNDYHDAVNNLRTRALGILHNVFQYNNMDDLVHDAIGCMKELEYDKVYTIDTRVSEKTKNQIRKL